MLEVIEEARQEATGGRMYLLALYYFLSRNLSVVAVLFGVFLVLLGGLVVPQYHRILAGMIGVWGVTMVVLGAVAYVFFLASDLIARATRS